ncbi:MAG TPA: NADH-quinone oxidoreductase subunit NuoF [Gaiellaceae bacterium]|nr:NADH-quinone oxidoreductase subunit NuoF [Gaiellaceae bacterium]
MAATAEFVFAGTNGGALTDIGDYEAVGGFKALARARAMAPDDVIEELNGSQLRGRGGAFFPTGRKWSFLPKPEQLPKPHYLVVNADESEPGSFKDNEILSRVPHRFIEGCLITAHAIDCDKVFVYIRGEYSGPYEILVGALEELGDKPDVRGNVTIVLHRGAGAYICGEETALIESLEGKRGQPRSKPPFPAISGVYASPTVVNNVETMATVPPILELGAAEYAKLGVENSRGTRVVSISGHVQNGGNYEIEPGISLRDLIYAEHLGGGVPGGRKLKAVIPGGSSTVVLTGDEIDVGYDFDSLAKLHTAMGSAGVICLDERVCMVQLGVRVSEFYEHESCGKCTPCREGTRWMTAILRKLEAGDASRRELDLLLDVCDRINGKCLCPLGDTAAMAVASYVAKFRGEFVAHIDGGGCPFGGTSPLDNVLAPVAMHAHAAVEVPT